MLGSIWLWVFMFKYKRLAVVHVWFCVCTVVFAPSCWQWLGFCNVSAMIRPSGCACHLSLIVCCFVCARRIAIVPVLCYHPVASIRTTFPNTQERTSIRSSAHVLHHQNSLTHCRILSFTHSPTLAHPALMLALCVKYLLFVWLCFAVWYVPCVCKCMYNVVCVVCDALVHLMCVCVLCSCCACRVRFACADRGGGDHMTQQKHVWCRANSNGCVCFLHVAYALPTLFDCCMCMRCAKDAVAHLCVMIPLPGQCCGPTLFDLCYDCVIYLGDVVAIWLCNALINFCFMFTLCVCNVWAMLGSIWMWVFMFKYKRLAVVHVWCCVCTVVYVSSCWQWLGFSNVSAMMSPSGCACHLSLIVFALSV